MLLYTHSQIVGEEIIYYTWYNPFCHKKIPSQNILLKIHSTTIKTEESTKTYLAYAALRGHMCTGLMGWRLEKITNHMVHGSPYKMWKIYTCKQSLTIKELFVRSSTKVFVNYNLCMCKFS